MSSTQKKHTSWTQQNCKTKNSKYKLNPMLALAHWSKTGEFLQTKFASIP